MSKRKRFAGRRTVISKRAAFMDLKKPDKLQFQTAECVQDAIEIRKIAPNGIFQVGERKWSKSYRVSDVNYTTKTYDEQLEFFYDWCKTIKAYDVAVKLTIFNGNRDMNEIREKILYPLQNDPYDWLRDSYNDIIENKIVDGRKGIKQEIYLTITVERNDYEAARSYLTSLEGSYINNYAALHSTLHPLSANERLRILYSFYHMGYEEEFDLDIEEMIAQGRNFKNELANTVIDFESYADCFRMDDKTVSVQYLDPTAYPTSLQDTFLLELAGLPIQSVYSIDYQPIPQDIAIRTLEEKLFGVETAISKQQERRNRSGAFSSEISYKVRREKKELEKMLDELRDNDQKMCWLGVSIALVTDSEDKMESAITAVNQVVEKASCRMLPYNMKQREALNTVLPIGGRYVDRMRAMFTSSAASFVPFNVVEMQMMDHPFYYGINQISKEPIWANRKKLLNGNGFVFAIPGAGKSFTGCKMEAGSVFLNTKDDIIFVDPTLEYFDVADAYGGTIINLATYVKNYVNPMEVDLKTLDKNDTNGQIREKCVFVLGICEQAMEGKISPKEKSIIDRCVRILYGRIAMLSVEERVQPILSDFIEVMKEQEEKEAQDIVVVMEIFVDGSLNIFNHPTNINPQNRVLVYGLRDLNGDLSGIAMLVMLENIRQRIIHNSKQGRATWLYVDEFHVLLNKPYSKAYFIDLWAQVRKLGGLCTGITQNVSTVLKDQETATLISNSEYTVLLKQAAPDAALLGKALENISEAQIKYTTNAEVGTGLLRFGNTIIPFDNRIDKNSPVYDIYNTNMHEKAAKKHAAGA
ncbi:MAG: VirB4-like conjugal transfer ATPase, CD1110 family [Roseburia sp.]